MTLVLALCALHLEMFFNQLLETHSLNELALLKYQIILCFHLIGYEMLNQVFCHIAQLFLCFDAGIIILISAHLDVLSLYFSFYNLQLSEEPEAKEPELSTGK